MSLRDEWGPEIGGAVDVKWTDATPGDELVGVWRGVATEGKYPAGVLEVDGVTKKIALPSVLQRKVGSLAPGTRIKLIYLGQQKSATGTAYHNFKVFAAKVAAASAPPPTPSTPPDPNNGEEVPF